MDEKSRTAVLVQEQTLIARIEIIRTWERVKPQVNPLIVAAIAIHDRSFLGAFTSFLWGPWLTIFLNLILDLTVKTRLRQRCNIPQSIDRMSVQIISDLLLFFR
jgi:hypothetical protein